jgi:hypothetical protein
VAKHGRIVDLADTPGACRRARLPAHQAGDVTTASSCGGSAAPLDRPLWQQLLSGLRVRLAAGATHGRIVPAARASEILTFGPPTAAVTP